MSEETIKIMLNMLNQINNKQDSQAAQLTQISERLAAIETKQATQDKINAEVEGLQSITNKSIGAKDIIVWLIPIILSIAALCKSYL